ncbi:MAG: GNAT family N-acetyltransferase [Candidatus Sericytochromatia bacterium]|nr:GNAT family N-acetyltransferase [Candidatus Sericytochromatia bacterium]
MFVLPAALSFQWLLAGDPGIREALAVRWSVFVDEQGLPAAEEVDEWDGVCEHLLAVLEGRTVGTARLIPLDAHTVRVGRVAVMREARHQGVATRLMVHCEDRARSQGREVVRLSAQWGVVSFYEQLGYAVTGAPYLEAGIVHVAMVKRLGPAGVSGA